MNSKGEKPWLWTSIAVVIAYMYVGNLYAHLMSSEIDDVVLAMATFVFMFLTYYVGYFIWLKYLSIILKIKKK
jgi:hypothetical protein